MPPFTFSPDRQGCLRSPRFRVVEVIGVLKVVWCVSVEVNRVLWFHLQVFKFSLSFVRV